ncbi:MAG: acyl-CoA dehydrogenase [Bdellovibrionales bacterium]|nr:acyl-CoA dehydrogenase [Bdellovibrionales bacterium]
MIFWPLLFFSVVVLLTVLQAPLFVWSVGLLFFLFVFQAHWLFFLLFFLYCIFIVIASVRRMTVTRFLMWMIEKLKIFPRISQTERTALEAGKTWVEKEFFSGKPELKKLFMDSKAQMTEEEIHFLNNETKTLCSMIDDWNIYKTRKIPDEVDQYIREKKFLGMIIPKSYGGLGFSHLAHSRVLETICSRSYAVGIYVMVPNSLGPGELLVHYGTEKQRKYYLPRLAVGQDIPCFGLTEPRAGSDASAIESKGVLFKDENGELKIKLNWNKRWITLASVSTVLGLAFQLEDPDELLGRGKDIGITCALIPSHLPGVKLGRRHDPMSIPFPNCPMEGHDVVVSAEDHIIGGIEKAGFGWSMLMDCLGTGRGISLPSSSLASSKRAVRAVTHHSVARRQFGLPIGKFEGVMEFLSEMAGLTFLSQSVLDYSLSALNRHIPSSLCSAISKYQLTEFSRQVVSKGMDILAGTGISMGPRNQLALSYMAAPIAITVEGANILTRSFIIFGQGLLRAHPFAYKEIKALEEKNVEDFDRYLWGHMGHVIHNCIRIIYLSLTRGLFVIVPEWRGKGYRAWQKIVWASCLFSVLSEKAMFTLGGQLKKKEQITGRFADVVINLYMASAVLWSWKQNKKDPKLWPFVQWSLDYSFYRMQKAFEQIIYNFELPVLNWVFWPFRKILLFFIRLNPLSYEPSDKNSQELAVALMESPDLLQTLTKGMYEDQNSQMYRLQQCHEMALKVRPIEQKIKKAMRSGRLDKKRMHHIKDTAFEKGVITKEEHQQISDFVDFQWDVIQVDSFSEEEYLA